MNKLKKQIGLLVSLMIIAGVLFGCKSKSESVKLADTVDQIQGMEDYTTSGTLSKSFSENVVYEVLNTSWDGEIGVAEVKVTTPDLEKVISDSIHEAIDECGTEDYEALFEKVKENVQAVLSSENCPTMKSTVEMEVEKTEDGYTLISNEEFEKIISGNLEEIFIQALMEGLANEN